MNSEKLINQIRLTQIKGIGNVLAKNLVAYIGCEEAIFKEKKKGLAKVPGIGEQLASQILDEEGLKKATKEYEFIVKNRISTYFFTEKEYPFRLKECNDAPILLFGKGNCNLNDSKLISVIGTRNATDYGKSLCQELIKNLALEHPEAIIVSGLAYGVDICAHKHALDYGLKTVGVVGHGLDRIYPSTHRSTAVKMIEHGMLITEYTSGTNPDRQNFVQRNRIIAGLCDATLVVESAEKGGALITAEIANEYNRDVFAFPGRIGDKWSEGCNKLIKANKAALIESAEDLINYMRWEKGTKPSPKVIQTSLLIDLTHEEKNIFEKIQQYENGIQLNEIAIELTQPVSSVSAHLLNLEFKGLIKCFPGNTYKVIS